MMLYKLLNDFELPQYNYESRTSSPQWRGQKVAPQIVPFTDGNPPTKVFNIHVIKLSTKGQKFCDSLNTAPVNRYLHTPSVGLNSGKWPRRMVLTTAGPENVVNIIKIDNSGKWGQVETYLPDEYPVVTKKELTDGNYNHALIHVFTTINVLGKLGGCPKGRAWYPLISNVPVWVSLDRVKLIV